MLTRRTSLKRKTRLRGRRRNWPKTLMWRILDRDEYMCQWPGCGRKANDAAHILNRSYRQVIWKEANVFSACRKHHKMGETEQGRVLLIALMYLRHKYDYIREPYTRYWRQACELLELANWDEREVVNLWKRRQNR